MRDWYIGELKKISLVVKEAFESKCKEEKFSKYHVHSFFIFLRCLNDLNEFDNEPNMKNLINFYGNISLHPKLNYMYRNPFIKNLVDGINSNSSQEDFKNLFMNYFLTRGLRNY